jgi:hypothetical protein
VVPQWGHGALLRLVVEEPLQCASGQPAVLRRLAGLLREVAWASGAGPIGERLQVLAARTADTARRTTDVPGAELQAWCDDVADASAGRWRPDRP